MAALFYLFLLLLFVLALIGHMRGTLGAALGALVAK